MLGPLFEWRGAVNDKRLRKVPRWAREESTAFGPNTKQPSARALVSYISFWPVREPVAPAQRGTLSPGSLNAHYSILMISRWTRKSILQREAELGQVKQETLQVMNHIYIINEYILLMLLVRRNKDWRVQYEGFRQAWFHRFSSSNALVDPVVHFICQ